MAENGTHLDNRQNGELTTLVNKNTKMEVSDIETDFSRIPNEKVKKANEWCLIAVFAMFGVLMRQGIDKAATPLEDDFGIPIYTSYFSNFVGCFLIGFFGQIAKSDIKLGLCTGLCGCLTTFSGWNNQQAWSLASTFYAADSYSRGVSITTWIVVLPAFIGAIAFGKDCGVIFQKRKPIEIPFVATVITMVALVVLFILLVIFVPDHRVIWLAAIFGIFGAMGRHGFGLLLNGIKGYPIGTFSANIVGSLIYTVLFIVKGRLNKQDIDSGSDQNALAIFFISAIMTGFCSSLTTISSFVNDMYNLDMTRRYIYAVTTILVAQLISCTIIAIAEYGFD